MDLLLLFISKYLLGYLLQSISCVLAVYAFNKEKIKFKKFAILALGFALSMIIIRSLPITPGVHTLLLLIVLSIMGVYILKVPIRNTIFSVLYAGICILVLELVTVLLVGSFIGFGNDVMQAFMADELNFSYAGIPANLLFLSLTLIIYYFKIKEKNKKI